MSRAALAALIVLAAGPLAAQTAPADASASAPISAPLPPARPDAGAASTQSEAADPEAGAATPSPQAGTGAPADTILADTTPETVPTPPARPEAAAAAALQDRPRILLPDDAPVKADEPPAAAARAEAVPAADTAITPTRPVETEAEFEACAMALDELGVGYRRAAEVSDPEDATCGIARPVTVSEIVPGVALLPEATLRCETALELAQWVASFAIPAASGLERGALTGIEQGTDYLCRRRNGDPEEVLSEHAFGNAIDIMAFRFGDGSTVKVQPREREGSMAEAFQDAARATACLGFTTVLGPGTDAAHADHLHLDVKARSGDFRLCQ